MSEIQQRLYHVYLMIDTASGMLSGEDESQGIPETLKPLHDKLRDTVNLLFEIRKDLETTKTIPFTPRVIGRDPEQS